MVTKRERALQRKLKQVERKLALSEDLLHRRQLECRQLEAAHRSQVKLNGLMAKTVINLRVRVRDLEVFIVDGLLKQADKEANNGAKEPSET